MVLMIVVSIRGSSARIQESLSVFLDFMWKIMLEIYYVVCSDGKYCEELGSCENYGLSPLGLREGLCLAMECI